MSVLHRLPLPEECRRIVEKFAFEPHPLALLVKKLRFEYSIECYMPAEDFFEPPALGVIGAEVGLLNRKTTPPRMYGRIPGDVLCRLLRFPYDEYTGNYVNPETYRRDPNDYDIDDSTSNDE